LAIPVYSGAAQRDLPATVTERVTAPWWDRLPRWLTRAEHRPWLIAGTLDLAATGFIVLAFTQTTFSAELMFHGVFVMLVLHAFLFGLRPTLIRIGLVSIPLVVYAEAAIFGLKEPPLELTEWPLMFVIAALVAWMADRRATTSQRYAALFRNASERLLTVEENERRRVARELHDGVGQVITALTLTLDAAESERDPAAARARIAAARSLADTALAGTRDLSHRMQPARFEERGLVSALRDLAAQSGFPVTIQADGIAAAAGLGPNTRLELFRIAQEALANAAHHSGAASATVTIAKDAGTFVLAVTDSGHGFEPADVPEDGIGLAGMLERARLIGGELEIDTGPGGTQVRVAVPIGAEGRTLE